MSDKNTPERDPDTYEVSQEVSELINHVLCAYGDNPKLHRRIDFHYLHHAPGHYYSPLPSREELDRVKDRVFAETDEPLGVDMREKEQLRLYARLVKWYHEMPFGPEPRVNLRYYFENDFFSYSDAFWLYALMREYKPKRIIEVGSGFSSCVMLDTNDLFFNREINLTFIEPGPERLISGLRDGEVEKLAIHQDLVQNVDPGIFDQLESGDILFIDSSHVGKIGSDVLYLLHHVLPRLKPGVLIHFHDIFYPFEYPRSWVEGGKAWNECYFMRTFLQYNDRFAIKLFGNYLGIKHRTMIEKHTPICVRNTGGSLWLEKLA